MADHHHHKRRRDDDDRHYRPQKKQHLDDRRDNPRPHNDRRPHHDRRPRQDKQYSGDAARLDSMPAQMLLPTPLPPLPPINDEYANAPFTHRSLTSESRSIFGDKELSYERLEFLGDAYIEVFASKLIYRRLHHLPPGQMSQMRELFVRNDTLSEYSRAYGFDKKIRVVDMQQMQLDAHKSNKGLNKILGDVFEAYVSAVILSHADERQGEIVAEQWLHALWEPRLREAIQKDSNYNANAAPGDPRKTYSQDAKAILQKRILGGNVKLAYETFKDSVELKGDKLGQNRHYIALYLTGFGYERKLLGKGEGKNKVEAGNWAAIEAMYGDAKEIVDKCEEICSADKAKREAERRGHDRRDRDVDTNGHGKREPVEIKKDADTTLENGRVKKEEGK